MTMSCGQDYLRIKGHTSGTRDLMADEKAMQAEIDNQFVARRRAAKELQKAAAKGTLNLRYIRRCAHCLTTFQSPVPDRQCCTGCFQAKHEPSAKTFEECPKCRDETSASIVRHIQATPEKEYRYTVKAGNDVMFRTDIREEAEAIADRVRADNTDVVIEDRAAAA